MALFADMNDFLDALDPARPVSRARLKTASFLGTIVEAASYLEPGERAATCVRCRRRPGRRACPGRVVVEVSTQDAWIIWCCSECKDQGTIRNWRGTPWDRARHHAAQTVTTPAADRVDLLFTDQEYAELAGLGHTQPVPETLFADARRVPEGVIVSASIRDLNALSWCIAQELDPERQQARLIAFNQLDLRLAAALRRWN
jgi:hypothetical protein